VTAAPDTVTADAVTGGPIPPPNPGRRATRAADRIAARAQAQAGKDTRRAGKDGRRAERRARRAQRRAAWWAKLPDRVTAFLAGGSVLGIAAWAGVYAYDSLYKLAEKHATYVPLEYLAPIGFETTLTGLVIWDIYTTWKGEPVPLLRWAARLFVGLSIVGNAWGGWPDPVGILFHLPAPTGFAVIVEGLRIILLKRMKDAKATARGRAVREPIPLARWINDPVRTYLFYRRWVMSNPENTDYFVQVDLEIKRVEALFTLRKHFQQRGKKWRREAPANYLWQLRRGVNISEVHAAVIAGFPVLGSGKTDVRVDTEPRRNRRTARRTGAGTARQTGAGTVAGTGPQTGVGTGAGTARQTGPQTGVGSGPAGGSPDWRHNVWRRATARGEPSGLSFDEYTRQYRERAIGLAQTFAAGHGGRFPDQEEFARLLKVQKVMVAGLHKELKQQFGLVK
jgi:hypothetical protein